MRDRSHPADAGPQMAFAGRSAGAVAGFGGINGSPQPTRTNSSVGGRRAPEKQKRPDVVQTPGRCP